MRKRPPLGLQAPTAPHIYVDDPPPRSIPHTGMGGRRLDFTRASPQKRLQPACSLVSLIKTLLENHRPSYALSARILDSNEMV